MAVSIEVHKNYFKNLDCLIMGILQNSNIPEEEKVYKIDRLKQGVNKANGKIILNNYYISTAHEIKSYELLNKYGSVDIAKDSNGEAGTDLKYLNYNIECVCCSSGDIKNNKLNDYRIGKNQKFILVDYNEKLKILLPRITQALYEKKEKINNYISNGIVGKNEPCIIFVSLGDISTDFFAGKYGFDFLRILMGVGHQVLKYDEETGKFCGSYYSRQLNIYKHNDKPIDANFLLHSENYNISAVIFTSADMNELYTKENTYLFLNPFAKNKVRVKDFEDFYYWKVNRKNEYIPRRKGKNLWTNVNK